jgi:hypothetical protein
MAIAPTRVAQLAIRILVLLGCLAVLLVAIVAGWLTFYTSDLPDIRPLSSFAPEVPAVVDAYICNEKTTVKAIQTTQMTDVRNALLASEGDIDQRSTVRRLHAYFLGRPEGREGYGQYSFEVSRQLFCGDHRNWSATSGQVNYWISTSIEHISGRVSTVSRTLQSFT